MVFEKLVKNCKPDPIDKYKGVDSKIIAEKVLEVVYNELGDKIKDEKLHILNFTFGYDEKTGDFRIYGLSII